MVALDQFVLGQPPQHVGLGRQGLERNLEVAGAVVRQVQAHTDVERAILLTDAHRRVEQVGAEGVGLDNAVLVDQAADHVLLVPRVPVGQGGDGHRLDGTFFALGLDHLLLRDRDDPTQHDRGVDLVLVQAAIAAIGVAALEPGALGGAELPRLHLAFPVHVVVPSLFPAGSPLLCEFAPVNAELEHPQHAEPVLVVHVALGVTHGGHLLAALGDQSAGGLQLGEILDVGDQVVVQTGGDRRVVRHQLDVVLADRGVQVIPQLVQLERAGVFHQLDFPGLALAVVAAHWSQDGCEVCGAGWVRQELEVRRGGLEPLSDRAPLVGGDFLGQGPVAVQAVAGTDHHRRGPTDLLGEREHRLGGFLLVEVALAPGGFVLTAVDVEPEGLGLGGVLRYPVLALGLAELVEFIQLDIGSEVRPAGVINGGVAGVALPLANRIGHGLQIGV